MPGLTAVRPPLAALNRVIVALAFLPPIFLVTTSPDVMTVVAAARRVTPEVFAAIAVVVVLVVLSRRLTVTGLTMTHSLASRAPGRLRAAGAAAGVLGPLSVIAAGWLDLAALLALIGAALPELIAIAVVVALLTLVGRYAARFVHRGMRTIRDRAHRDRAG